MCKTWGTLVQDIDAIIKERAKVYCDPHDAHKAIALGIRMLILARTGIDIGDECADAHFGAMCMMLMKITRAERPGEYNYDTWKDMLAYNRFAFEMDPKRKKKGQ